MRAADRVEVWACGYDDLHKAVTQSLSMSTHSAALLVEGRLAMVLGVTPLSLVTGSGSPWALGTDLVQAHRRALIRLVPAYIRTMLRAYPHLENHVHTENAVAVGWLRRAGFTLEAPAPYGPRGALFHRFTMDA